MKPYFTQELDNNQKLCVADSVKEDVADLAPRLRIEDVQEIRANSGETQLGGLMRSFVSSSVCYTIRLEGVIVGMFGVVPTPEAGIGIVWFLGSPELFSRRSFTFLRHSKAWLNNLLDRFSILYNVVDARNVKHIAWLRWLGFTFPHTFERYGFEQRPFHVFYYVCASSNSSNWNSYVRGICRSIGCAAAADS